MSAFIRQSGRQRRKDTDIYREIQLNVTLNQITERLLTELAKEIINSFIQWDNYTVCAKSSLLEIIHVQNTSCINPM